MVAQSIAVWAWLAGATHPVVVGKLTPSPEGRYSFVYGKSYLSNPLAYALQPGLPLAEKEYIPSPGLEMHGVFRDALPDGWGQNVIDYQHGGQPQSLEIYMLESGSSRFGNLDFQISTSQYVPRAQNVNVETLETDIRSVLARQKLSSVASLALVHGTSIGGAKPKIATEREIIKLSTSDTGLSIRREAFATLLAERMGVNTVKARLTRINNRDALVVGRFDRDMEGGRIPTLSLLTLSGESEMTARYTSYRELYSQLVQHCGDAYSGVGVGSGESAGVQIFRRIAANIMLGNNDDHARNHAVFWNGTTMRLAPAFDIEPVRGSGWESNQAISYGASGQRESSLDTLIEASGCYGISRVGGLHLVEEMLDLARAGFTEVFDQVGLPRDQTAGMFHESIWEGHPLPSPAKDI
ncbi:type II toxin-antitoxin system HipA family toxin [Mobiluncus mulieris]|uniref:Type II toxin-antitoxin system HipA family toxin n=1 Tax=Mobiluncus mulieris TaxID=2052 RepID=A0A7Y0U6J7_9ACTO|nr:type II toxin-antitoxin system HipA family toxin [Mobiluncus mulieris]MCU9969487.1 type II toxin-antitoxin system HipA family toxin [Mobiluncus mulieris]MCU9973926.1 type II toxin-antitoxin system HipA family toxin [Mobiluncus mulieris]MCV0009925.1 type II toxin-antitoxin system HipA family toxin [Mobiluncus mulieris]MCV0014974.1 type II toxin-antitoxin system HipA family toxin [Mobiluncus mulieris]NMW65914.1 type II toxin-antitoxin system HipA family toxin [Mobiluncus mulieris]